MRKDIKASVQKRLGRIEGQVRGLSKMVEEERYCIDIVTQIAAGRKARELDPAAAALRQCLSAAQDDSAVSPVVTRRPRTR